MMLSDEEINDSYLILSYSPNLCFKDNNFPQTLKLYRNLLSFLVWYKAPTFPITIVVEPNISDSNLLGMSDPDFSIYSI
jgi:hypothetical protein